MKSALTLAAVGEAATGLALVIVPSFVLQLLLGEQLTDVALPVARVSGLLLIALGNACWPGTTTCAKISLTLRLRIGAGSEMKRREFLTLMGGTAAAWPLTARAQQPVAASATLGLLSPAGIGAAGVSPVFIEALDKLGYRQGRNLTSPFRAANDSNAELAPLATE